MGQLLQSGFGLGGWIPGTLPAGAADGGFVKESDAYWMSKALRRAMEAVGTSSPNPTVGCVFVAGGQQIAIGATEVFGGLHAERVAIEACSDRTRLAGATCYVTLEPCAHHGKQPPCVEALVATGIKRCVIGVVDPFHAVDGRGVAYLRQHGIDVSVGVLGPECAAWHFPFLAQQILGRPVIVGKWAQTLDGHLADDLGGSQWITGSQARQHTHWLRQKYDAIAVGGGTAVADQPALTVRDCGGSIRRQPKKLIYDPEALLLSASPTQQQRLMDRLLTGEVVFWGTKPLSRIGKHDHWLVRHDRVIRIPLAEDDFSFASFVEKVGLAYPQYNEGKALQSVLVEGGPTLLTSLLDANELDAAHAFINPSVIGGQRHRLGSLLNLWSPISANPQLGRHVQERLRFEGIALNPMAQDILWDLLPLDRYEQIWLRLLAGQVDST
jgi:diaminohydroxyphosphoribosylaminopyrimidine deaminase/5-amino-6-(5-phosphoribosylamino)uracil reductase